MSLVTRATSAPRRSSLWSARLSRWMWPISRPRRWNSASSLRVPRRTTAWRWAIPEMTRATAAISAEHGDEADADASVADDAAVDRLLQQDRHDDPPDGADDRQHPRDAEALAQDRRLLQAAPDRVHRREPRRRRREATARLDEHVSHRRLPTTASARPPARSALERLDQLRGTPALRAISSACVPWSTTVPRST